MRGRAWLVALSALGGCGRIGFEAAPPGDGAGSGEFPVVAPPPVTTNGTRLVSVAATRDGARDHDRWYDALLGVDCWFIDDGTGTQRCLPLSPSKRFDYADDACSISVAAAPTETLTCGSASTFATSGLPGDPVHRVGDPYTGAVYQRSAGCGLRSLVIPTTFWRLGAVEPMTTFVAAHEELTRSGAFSYVERVGADGSRERLRQLVDHVRGGRCEPVPIDGDTAVCVDLATLGSARRAFKDAACSQPILVTDDEGATLYSLEPDRVCDGALRIIEKGSPYVGPVYDRANGCIPTTEAVTAFELGANRTADLPLLRRVLAGAGRVRESLWQLADGNEIWFSLWDTEREAYCAPGGDDTGDRLLCAPTSPLATQRSLYTDAACTGGETLHLPCLGPAPGVGFPRPAGNRITCNGVTQEYRVLEVPVLTPFWEQSDAGCVPLDAPVPPRRMTSTAMDPSSFPVLTFDR